MVLPILLTLFCDRCGGLFKTPALRPICQPCHADALLEIANASTGATA